MTCAFFIWYFEKIIVPLQQELYLVTYITRKKKDGAVNTVLFCFELILLIFVIGHDIKYQNDDNKSNQFF
jgi:hypothetical protein